MAEIWGTPIPATETNLHTVRSRLNQRFRSLFGSNISGNKGKVGILVLQQTNTGNNILRMSMGGIQNNHVNMSL